MSLGILADTRRSKFPQELDFMAPDAADQYFRARMACQRGTPGRYFDATGRQRIAGPNQPRFDYDPITKKPRGLICGPAHQNYLFKSNTFNAWNAWFGGLANLKYGDFAPDGSNTAWSFPVSDLSTSPDGYNSGLFNMGAAEISNGVMCTAAVWVRADVQRTVNLSFDDGQAFSTHVIGPEWRQISTTAIYNGPTRKIQLVWGRGATESQSSRIYLWQAQMGPAGCVLPYIETDTAVGYEESDHHWLPFSPFFVGTGGHEWAMSSESVSYDRVTTQGILQIGSSYVVGNSIHIDQGFDGTMGAARYVNAQLVGGINQTVYSRGVGQVDRVAMINYFDGNYGSAFGINGQGPMRINDGQAAWPAGIFEGAWIGWRQYAISLCGYMRRIKYSPRVDPYVANEVDRIFAVGTNVMAGNPYWLTNETI